MPEGDTIHTLAIRLRPALVGRSVVRVEVPRARSAPRAGTAVAAVDAVGKHLVIRFADGHVLRTHLRMSGRWDLYAPGSRWRRPAGQARAVVEVEGAVAVCFAAPLVELTRAGDGAGPAGLAALAHLGPDLCLPGADVDLAVARMTAVPEPGTAIADVLLDQRVAAGVGNVYKSEVLWACRLHPLTPLEQVDEPTRRRLVATAAELLRGNVGSTRRTTLGGPGRGDGLRGPGRLAVYRRARRPCPRCATPITWARTGARQRSTYWCRRCQPELVSGGAGGAG